MALLITHWVAKCVMVILVWALAHHVLAGIRHMLMDVAVGSPLRMARRSAWAVESARNTAGRPARALGCEVLLAATA